MQKGEFTDQNIDEAKTNIISTINFIPDEQDTEVIYYFSQELSGYAGKIRAFNQQIKKYSVTFDKTHSVGIESISAPEEVEEKQALI